MAAGAAKATHPRRTASPACRPELARPASQCEGGRDALAARMPMPSCPHPSSPRATTGKLSAPSRLEMRSKGNRRPCSCQIGGRPPGPTPNPPSSVFKEICQEGLRAPLLHLPPRGLPQPGARGLGVPYTAPQRSAHGEPASSPAPRLQTLRLHGSTRRRPSEPGWP